MLFDQSGLVFTPCLPACKSAWGPEQPVLGVASLPRAGEVELDHLWSPSLSKPLSDPGTEEWHLELQCSERVSEGFLNHSVPSQPVQGWQLMLWGRCDHLQGTALLPQHWKHHDLFCLTSGRRSNYMKEHCSPFGQKMYSELSLPNAFLICVVFALFFSLPWAGQQCGLSPTIKHEREPICIKYPPHAGTHPEETNCLYTGGLDLSLVPLKKEKSGMRSICE